MALSDMAVRKAKATERPYRLMDDRGLYLLVHPDGAKWWRLDFKLNNKRRTMSFGRYPDVELAKARDDRDAARKLIAVGVDPVRARKSTKALDNSFEAFARRWIKKQEAEWTDRYRDFVISRLEANIFPEIGAKFVGGIEPPEMLACIRRIEGRGALEVSNRMNNVCGRIFRSAIAEGIATRDPTPDIREALTKSPPKKHRAALKPAQMPAFLVKLTDDGEEETDTLDAMWLTLTTAVRTVETRFAAKDEFEGLDGPSPLWRLSPERMKMENEHLVPLSKQAVKLVKRRLGMMRPGQKLLFARPTRSGTISENTMLYALYRLGYRGRATMHGFRGTFSTVANSATRVVGDEEVRLWDRDWIELQLAHVERDEVRAAYNAAEYLPQRRRLMQWWADWLDSQLELARLIG